MTETVWIFGDSFSHRQPSLGARKTWPRMLEKHYNVVNYSLDGTGPDWSLEKLVDSSNDTDTSVHDDDDESPGTTTTTMSVHGQVDVSPYLN